MRSSFTSGLRRPAAGCGAGIRDACRHREHFSFVDGGRACRCEDRRSAFDHRTGLFPRRTTKRDFGNVRQVSHAAGRGEELLNNPRVRAVYLGV